MSSKQQDVAKSNISPVLFMTVDGEPMSFFLRPGPAKCKLQPLITAGGGIMCNVQHPGAILLRDPEERGFIAESTAHWYVSTQYIHDCVLKDEQLNLEDYRLNPEVVPRHSARLSSNRERSPGLSGGRVAYTAEDDAAILSFVSKHKTEVGGNRLWQEMEKQCVTSHSWQSMKYRYRVRLAKKQSEVMEVATTEEDAKAAKKETKVEGNQETDAVKPSSTEDAASSQTHSTESDQTQIDAQCMPAESPQLEIAKAETSICLQEEEQHVNPQTDEQPAESTQEETVEAETSPQPEDPPTYAQPIPAESTEPETDESQTNISPQKDSTPKDDKSLPDTSSQGKPKEKQKVSPRLEERQRRVTRRQLQLEDSSSPEPCGKKLRSSPTSAEQSSSFPQPSKKKTKSAVKSALQKDSTVDQPPYKKAKGKSAAAVGPERQQEESAQAAILETTQAVTESNSVPQRGEKNKEKRKMGILELAAKEFEEESESDGDRAPDLQNPPERAATLTKSSLPTSDTATFAQSDPEHGPSLKESLQETQASISNCPPPAGCPEPAATEAVATEAATAEAATTEAAATEAAATEAAASVSAATEAAATEATATEAVPTEPAVVDATSKAHLFIFQNESQEEDSQSIFGDNTAAPAIPQPTVNKDAAFSLTQDELEENKQRIRELMKETNQDLVNVTKALLRTSGDFSVARDLLLDPSSVPGPFWKRSDDALLLSGDPVVRQQLQEIYGEENVAKRIMFLEV